MNRTGICGCCEGISFDVPAIENRPGLSTIAYRVGTWAQFKSRMLDLLSVTPELVALRTRSDDDFEIALLDAWAVVCDVITFYSERIVNESYLRTATERLSIGELAKLIGYKLRPGVAASAALAFILDQPVVLPKGLLPQANPVPSTLALVTGTKVQSVPGPNEQPAIFETIEAVESRASWNAIYPRMTFPLDGGVENVNADVRLRGLFSDLQVGDSLLLTPRDVIAPRVQTIIALEPNTDTKTTLVHFASNLGATPAPPPTSPGTLHPWETRLDDALIWASIKGHTWADQTALAALAAKRGWSLDALEAGINALRGRQPPSEDPPLRVFTLKVHASLFGHNAPPYNTIPAAMRFDTSVRAVGSDGKPTWPATWDLMPAPYPPPGWDDDSGNPLAQLANDAVFINAVNANLSIAFDLDNVYSSIVAGDWLVLEAGDLSAAPFTARVLSSSTLTRTDYLITGKVTRILLDGDPNQIMNFFLRTTHVFGQTDELPVADVALNDIVGSDPLTLDGAYLSLKIGQLVSVTGERADKAGEIASEVTTINALSLVDGYTQIVFDPELSSRYVRNTVKLNANVAHATHGETKSEILGGGDATLSFQRFKLKQPPLTYISAATPSGVASTLRVRVNGVRWDEVPWLYGHGPDERIYTVIVDQTGATWVQFGDGATGARVPSGRDNVQATYRQGIGLAGMVRAGQLSMLLSRPLGLKDASNPLASSGAGDPETLANARANAPITVRTLDRIVSLEDFEDFARASAAIAKASVTWSWDGTRDVACVTVAGINGAQVVPGTPVYDNLLAAMRDAGDGMVPATLHSYLPVSFSVGATITVDPARVGSAVLDDVKAALRAAFSFDARDFMQPVFRSEVIAVMQEVIGVVALTLDAFDYSGTSSSTQPDGLPASPPTLGLNGLVGAQLLTLESGLLPNVVVKS